MAIAGLSVSGCCCCTPVGTLTGGNLPGNAMSPGSHEAVAALDWLPVAEGAMMKENSQAMLISVHGWSADRKIILPIDGKCRWWQYQYVSSDKKQVYDVYVHDGAIESIGKRSFSEGGMESLICKNDNPRIETWVMDSTDAADIANERYKELTGQALPAQASYTLEVSPGPINEGRLTWGVCYYDETSRVIASFDIDYQRESVIYYWIP